MIKWYNVIKIAALPPQEKIPVKEEYSATEISKEDKVKQTATVEKLIRESIQKNLPDYSNKVFAVGGFVRDQLLGSNPKDLDLVVDDPEAKMKSAEIFVKKLADVLKITGPNNPHVLKKTYGIWGIDLVNPRDHSGVRKPFIYDGVDLSGYTIEVTPPREEGPYDEYKREPKWVDYTSRKEDALRRDLTVNSIYKNIVTGEIEDYTGGREDLSNRILKKPHHPKRDRLDIYRDDPLRLLRLLRFSGKLKGFSIDPSTEKDAKEFISSSEGQSIVKNKLSAERIRDEFTQILTNTDGAVAVKGLELMRDFGLLKYISPTLEKLAEVFHDKVHHRGESVWEHTLEVIRRTPPSEKARLAALFHDIGKIDTLSTKVDKEGKERFQFIGHEEKSPEYVTNILRELRYPADVIDSVKNITHAHMGMKNIDAEKAQTQLKRIRVFIERLYDNMDDALDLMQADIKDTGDPTERQEKVRKFNELRMRIKSQAEIDKKSGLFLESGKGMMYKSPLKGEDLAEEYKKVQRELIQKRIEKGKLDVMTPEEIEQSLKNLEGKALGAVKYRLKEMTMEGRFGEGEDIARKARDELKNLLSNEQQIRSLVKKMEEDISSKSFYKPKKP